AYAVKKIRSRNHDDRSNGSHSKSGSRSVLSSAVSSGWDAAADTLVPIAEDAAGAAGRYVAKRGPDFLKERIVPKFIEAFNDAKKLIGEGESESGKTSGRSRSGMRPSSSGGRGATAKAKSATNRRTMRSAPKAGSKTAKRSSTGRSSASTTSNRGRTREDLY